MKKVVSIILVTAILQTLIGLSFSTHYLEGENCTTSMPKLETHDDCDDSNSEMLEDCCEDHNHVKEIEAEGVIKENTTVNIKCSNISNLSLIPKILYKRISSSEVKKYNFYKYMSQFLYGQPKIYLLKESFLC